MYHDAIVLVILTMIAPKIADQNPSTTKPSSIAATNPNIAAFKTSKNKPRVTTVIGKVRTNAIGLMIALTRHSSRAAIIMLPVPTMWTPGIRADARYKPSIIMRVRRTIPAMD